MKPFGSSVIESMVPWCFYNKPLARCCDRTFTFLGDILYKSPEYMNLPLAHIPEPDNDIPRTKIYS